MANKQFPSVEEADEHGIVAIGGDFEPETLIEAYRQGIFPWTVGGYPYVWFAPPMRAVLFFEDFHISQSLKKIRRKEPFTFRIDTNFDGVITGCARAKNRKHRGTWLTPEYMNGYRALYERGYCHCIEAYEGEKLVGGIYGVSVGKLFSAESMFYTKPNASKLALCFLVDYLQERGVQWIDCQVLNEFTRDLGAVEIKRERFTAMVAEYAATDMQLFAK